MISNFKKSEERKTQVTRKPKFASSRDSRKKRLMHTRIDNEDIMVGNDTDGIIKDLFDFFLKKYQQGV